MVDMVKAFADIALDNPGITCMVCEKIYSLQRHGCIPHRTETVGVTEKLCFKNRLQHNSHALLYDSVPHRGNPQWALFSFSWFVDVDPAYLLRFKMSKRKRQIAQRLYKARQKDRK